MPTTANKTIKKEARPWLTRNIQPGDWPQIYKELKVPFPSEAIRKGKTYYNVEIIGVRSQYIAERLNDVLGINHWKYAYNSVDEMREKSYSAKCDITIEIGNMMVLPEGKSVFVPLASRSYVGGVINPSKFEAHKGAITNAMKKCASMFGVAGDIYKGIADPDLIENGQTYEEMPETQAEKETTVTQEEEPLPIGEKGDGFSQLLTELNSVKDKATYIKAKEMMDKVSGDLEPEQMEIAIKALVELEKKYGK